jgi:hypothetical protein
MLFKPLKDADVREAESAAAFERYTDGRSAWRLHIGQGGTSCWVFRSLRCGSG